MARIGRRNINVSRANNSNALAAQRAQAAQRTAQSIAANRRNAREAALRDVHYEIDSLTSIPPKEQEYVVERLVPARFQPIAQSRIPRILRRQGVLRPEDEPMTVFEYAQGHPESSTNPQRVRVAEILRGWVLPHIVEQPDPYPNRHRTGPSQYETGSLIVVSDHRSWAGGVRPHYAGPVDSDPHRTMGVVDNNYALGEDHAIETLSHVPPNASQEFTNGAIEKLEEISNALTAIRHDTPPPMP